MVIFSSKIDFAKKCPDRFESVIYDQEMSRSVQFSDFKLDRWTFNMFPEDLKTYKILNTWLTFAQKQTFQNVSRSIRKC